MAKKSGFFQLTTNTTGSTSHTHMNTYVGDIRMTWPAPSFLLIPSYLFNILHHFFAGLVSCLASKSSKQFRLISSDKILYKSLNWILSPKEEKKKLSSRCEYTLLYILVYRVILLLVIIIQKRSQYWPGAEWNVTEHVVATKDETKFHADEMSSMSYPS